MPERDVIEPFYNQRFYELAERMQISNRLRKKDPFVLSSRLWLNVETKFDFPAKMHLVFSKELYEKLSPEERLAAAAHEFAHIRERHYLDYYNRSVVKVLTYAPILISLLFFGYMVHAFILNEPVFFLLSQSAAILGFFIFTVTVSSTGYFLGQKLNWDNLEIKADSIAADYVGPTNIEAVLSKIKMLREESHAPFFKRLSLILERDHPDTERRILLLRQHKESAS
jgi:Zn-dependent protease with chaperone function